MGSMSGLPQKFRLGHRTNSNTLRLLFTEMNSRERERSNQYFLIPSFAELNPLDDYCGRLLSPHEYTSLKKIECITSSILVATLNGN